MTVARQYKISEVTVYLDDDFFECEAIVSVDSPEAETREIHFNMDSKSLSVKIEDLKAILQMEDILISPALPFRPVDRCLKSHET